MPGKFFSTAIAVIISFSISLSAQTQTINLSKSLPKIATSQKLAVAPDSGNILIVFNQLDINDSSYSRIYAVLLKKQGDGSYKKSPPRMISPDSEWHARPTVGYVKAKKQFLVFWDNSDPAKPFSQASIFGRWVNSKTGKASGGQFVMVGTNDRNVFPTLFIVSGDAGEVGAPLEEPFGFLFYSRYPIPSASPANELDTIGIYYRGLQYESSKLTPQSDGETKVDDGQISGGYYLNGFFEGGGIARIRYSTEPEIRYGGTFYGHQQVRNEGGSGTTTRGFLRTLTFADNPQNYNQVATTNFQPETVAMGKAFISQNGETVVYTVTIRKLNSFQTSRVTQSPMINLNATLDYGTAFKGKAVTQSTFIENGRLRLGYSETESRPTARATMAWQLSAAKDGWVYKRKVVASGKPTGGLKKLFTHGNKIQSMTSDILWYDASAGTRKFNSIVIWQKRINDGKHELIAQLFSVD